MIEKQWVKRIWYEVIRFKNKDMVTDKAGVLHSPSFELPPLTQIVAETVSTDGKTITILIRRIKMYEVPPKDDLPPITENAGI